VGEQRPYLTYLGKSDKLGCSKKVFSSLFSLGTQGSASDVKIKRFFVKVKNSLFMQSQPPSGVANPLKNVSPIAKNNFDDCIRGF